METKRITATERTRREQLATQRRQLEEAAPALYEACKALLADDGTGTGKTARELARAALALADGEGVSK